jgi:hypothetical protein
VVWIARQLLTHSSHRGSFRFALQQTLGRFIRSFGAGLAECSLAVHGRTGMAAIRRTIEHFRGARFPRFLVAENCTHTY